MGTSFLALPLGRVRFCVDKYMWSPTWYISLAQHFLLAWNVCWMQFVIIVLWATIRSYFACKVNCLTPLNVVSNDVGILIWGMCPWFSSNRANPVVALCWGICIYAQGQSNYISAFSFILFVYYYPFTVCTSFQFFLNFSLFFFPFHSH